MRGGWVSASLQPFLRNPERGRTACPNLEIGATKSATTVTVTITTRSCHFRRGKWMGEILVLPLSLLTWTISAAIRLRQAFAYSARTIRTQPTTGPIRRMMLREDREAFSTL